MEGPRERRRIWKKSGDRRWMVMRLEEVVVVVCRSGGAGGIVEGCGLPSLLRRATVMTLVKGIEGPSPTRLPHCARPFVHKTGAEVVRRSLRIEMPDVTDPPSSESGLSMAYNQDPRWCRMTSTPCAHMVRQARLDGLMWVSLSCLVRTQTGRSSTRLRGWAQFSSRRSAFL